MSEGLVESYFGRRFFLFVPNICDAACAFCYVAPAPARQGFLAPGVMRRAERVFERMALHGFREVRITGGEPLVFRNARDLFWAAKQRGLRTTLLTNGIALAENVEWIVAFGLQKVTVSVHTLSEPQRVFGVDRDSDSLLRSISDLRRGGIRVCATFVTSGEVGLEEVAASARQVADVGVDEFKVVRLNMPNSSAKEFTHTVSAIRRAVPVSAAVRASDLTMPSCQLRTQGSLAVTLPRGDVFRCCATVGEEPPIANALAEDLNFGGVLEREAAAARNIEGLPCDAWYGSCPIALLPTESPSLVRAGSTGV